jgi:hypothetical protein
MRRVLCTGFGALDCILPFDRGFAAPLSAALPLFATGIGALGLFGWRSKRQNTAAVLAS